MKTFLITALSLAGFLSSASQSIAQQTQNPDVYFIQKAADGGMLELALGQMALKKGESQKIKEFAKMMIDDHTKVNDELMALAKKKKLELPKALSNTKKLMSDSLSSESGNRFDMLYMNMMLASHEETIGLFQDEATGGKDVDLKQWAKGKIPALKHHLEMAKKLFDQN
jgi:putative membrane protein